MISNIIKHQITYKNKKVVAHKLTVVSKIPIDINIAWDKVQNSDLLIFVSKDSVKFKPTNGSFPEKWKQGETVSTKMLMYGFIPLIGWHTLYFNKIDNENKIIETYERDPFAKVWNHTISMKKIDTNLIEYKDEVIIYGGIFTGLISWWAKSFYKSRQKNWLKVTEHSKCKL